MQPRLTWPQMLLLASVILGLLNAVHQSVFATAAVSGWLAGISAAQALAAAVALRLLRLRHTRAALALGIWAVLLLSAVVLGTELLLGHALAFRERLPGYLAAVGFAALSFRGGVRELARARAPHVGEPSLAVHGPEPTPIGRRDRSRRGS
jgi:hypothetical protein